MKTQKSVYARFSQKILFYFVVHSNVDEKKTSNTYQKSKVSVSVGEGGRESERGEWLQFMFNGMETETKFSFLNWNTKEILKCELDAIT